MTRQPKLFRPLQWIVFIPFLGTGFGAIACYFSFPNSDHQVNTSTDYTMVALLLSCIFLFLALCTLYCLDFHTETRDKTAVNHKVARKLKDPNHFDSYRR